MMLMRCLPAVLFGLMLAFAFAAPHADAQDECTSDQVLAKCPSLCRERCRSDKAFQARNTVACVQAFSVQSVDESSCTDDPDDPVARLHREDDFPICTESIPALEQWYTDINEKLARSLDTYKPILENKFDETRDEKTLCAYGYEEIANAYRLSVRDKDSLADLKGEMSKADACSDQVMRWQIGADMTVSNTEGPIESETAGTGKKPSQKILKAAAAPSMLR